MNDRDEYLLDLYFKRDERAVAETQREYGSFCLDLALRILPIVPPQNAESQLHAEAPVVPLGLGDGALVTLEV